MKKHQLILEDYVDTFKQRVDEFCGEGWLVLAGSVTIKETDSGHRWFSCVMESQDEPYPDEMVFHVMSDEERQAVRPVEQANEPTVFLDKLIVGFAAASNSRVVQLQYDNNTGVWSLFRSVGHSDGIVNTVMLSGKSHYPDVLLLSAIDRFGK